jgi:hypothetical protein
MMIDDPSFRIVIVAAALASLIAAVICWQMQFGRPSSSKHPQR